MIDSIATQGWLHISSFQTSTESNISIDFHVVYMFCVIALCQGLYSALCIDILHNPFSDLSPNGVWEVGAVLEGDEIYQGYSDRFLLKFLEQCQVYKVDMNVYVYVCVHMWMNAILC